MEVAGMSASGLCLAESILANLQMDGDPSWIISVGGGSITDCLEWEMTEQEKESSHLTVSIGNPEMRNSGKYKYGKEMEIRFGYDGMMSEPAHFKVAEVTERYPTGKGPIITVTGKDASQKMGGGGNKGNHSKKGEDSKEALKKALEAQGLKLEGDAQGTKDGCGTAAMNESDRALAFRLGNGMSGGMSDTSGGGAGPISPLAGDSNGSAGDADRSGGFTYPAAAKWAGDGKAGEADKNRGKNHGGRQSQDQVKGKLVLKGFPALRAKRTVTVLGVGPEASGEYYVKKCTHSWKPGQGYLTSAELSRGGTGPGGVGGSPPMVMYADIWKKDTMYLGTRQTNAGAQCIFTYGEGRHLIEFEMKVAPQENRGGGEGGGGGGGGKGGKAKGMGLDIKNRLNVYATGLEEGAQGEGK
jgi:hypothetical protein